MFEISESLMASLTAFAIFECHLPRWLQERWWQIECGRTGCSDLAGVDMQMGDGGALFCDSGYGVDC